MSRVIRILPTQQELFAAAAEEFAVLAQQAVAAHGRFCVALSGGSTPRGLFTLLASGVVAGVPWEKVFCFWGDERHVPSDSPDSNYRMANETLLSRVPIPPQNIFRFAAENPDAKAAADGYEKTLRSFFKLEPGQIPRFDLIHLGIGPDGHTASLFPGTSALQERTRLVVANRVEKMNTDRLTFTLPVLNHAAVVEFLVSGADKASIIHEILENPSANLPAQLVNPEVGKLEWIMDRAAAGGLSQATLNAASVG